MTLLLLACANPFRDAEHVATWANTASAVAVYVNVFDPLGYVDGEVFFDDPACPQITDDGATVVLQGGCTDAFGETFVGTATVARDGDDLLLTADGWGRFTDPDLEAALSGTFDRLSLGPDRYAFVADLVHAGGMTTTLAYDGEVVGAYGEPSVWSGRGTVTREGPVAPTGTVDAETTDERLDDDVCIGQAVSGKTVLASEGHEAVVSYDGGEDCDDAQAAKLTVDGKDRGLVEGVGCATPVGSAPLPALAALALCRRRRGRADRSVGAQVLAHPHGHRHGVTGAR